jgi:transposase
MFELQQAVDAYDFYQRQMKKCDQQLRRYMAAVPTRASVPTPVSASSLPSTKKGKQGRARKPRGKNLPAFDLASELERILGVNAATIDGIDVMTIQTVLAEVGPNLNAWKTEPH